MSNNSSALTCPLRTSSAKARPSSCLYSSKLHKRIRFLWVGMRHCPKHSLCAVRDNRANLIAISGHHGTHTSHPTQTNPWYRCAVLVGRRIRSDGPRRSAKLDDPTPALTQGDKRPVSLPRLRIAVADGLAGLRGKPWALRPACAATPPSMAPWEWLHELRHPGRRHAPGHALPPHPHALLRHSIANVSKRPADWIWVDVHERLRM